MKSLKRTILTLVACIASAAIYAQNNGGIEPAKFASWTISECFQAEAGYVGSYWKPTFNIAKDQYGYYCVVNLYNQTGWYETGDIPHLYLKTSEGKIVELSLDGDEPVHKLTTAGYRVGYTYMPMRYVTRLIYAIPDIDEFLNSYYVKYRVWLGEEFKDIEMDESYAKKFNKRIRNAYDAVTKKYEAKSQSMADPTAGF